MEGRVKVYPPSQTSLNDRESVLPAMVTSKFRSIIDVGVIGSDAGGVRGSNEESNDEKLE